MKMFIKNGKFGAREGIKVIVPAVYDDMLQMVENDPYFTKKQEVMDNEKKQKPDQKTL